jgi:hypothetical protein
MSEEIIESVLTDFPDAVYYPKAPLNDLASDRDF